MLTGHRKRNEVCGSYLPQADCLKKTPAFIVLQISLASHVG